MNMDLLSGDVCESYPRRDFITSPLLCCPQEVLFTRCGESQQPQYAVRDPVQDAQPDGKYALAWLSTLQESHRPGKELTGSI